MALPPWTIALIFGTRPEAIKLAPVYLELARRPDLFEPKIWLTAQHREMLDQVMAAFELEARRDFNLMLPDQTLTTITSNVLTALAPALKAARPHCVLVQGDTTTVMTAALAAFYNRVPVGHVEAGLRTHDKFAPYPEEMNRQIAARLTDFHFAPTPLARDNLLREGISDERIFVTGNTVIDALAIAVERVRRQTPDFPDGFPLEKLEHARRMVLITGHRRENFGQGFESICHAFADLAGRYPETEWVYPVHLNPNVLEPVHRMLGGRPNIHLTQPLGYLPFVWAMDRCHFIVSDSGGVQEEAPHLGKPVLVTREKTERPEAVDAGASRLVGTDRDRIVAEASRLMDDAAVYAEMSRARNPYGDGRAAVRIADALEMSLRQTRTQF